MVASPRLSQRPLATASRFDPATRRDCRSPPRVWFESGDWLEIGLDRNVGRELLWLLPFADGAEKGFGLLRGGSKDRRFAFRIHEQ